MTITTPAAPRTALERLRWALTDAWTIRSARLRDPGEGRREDAPRPRPASRPAGRCGSATAPGAPQSDGNVT